MASRSLPRLVKIGQLATPVHGHGKSESKARDLFREVCRCLPWVVDNYKLGEITAVSELRSNVSKLFKLNSELKSPGAIDVLIFKGREELEMILLQHKQRHHIIAEYIKRPQQLIARESKESPFLQQFFKGNQDIPQPLGHTTKGI